MLLLLLVSLSVQPTNFVEDTIEALLFDVLNGHFIDLLLQRLLLDFLFVLCRGSQLRGGLQFAGFLGLHGSYTLQQIILCLRGQSRT